MNKEKVKQWIIWIFINICIVVVVILFCCGIAELKKQELESYHKQRMSEEHYIKIEPYEREE